MTAGESQSGPGSDGAAAGGGLRRTPLHALHGELGAKLVPFAGYEMPVQYSAGILKEHLHTRAEAGLFDVSHMGQAVLTGPGAEAAIERLTPVDAEGLKPGRQRYTQLLNDRAGIIDDLMVSRLDDDRARAVLGPGAEPCLFLVVNAARKDVDFARIGGAADGDAVLQVLEDRALIALQGPQAASVLGEHAAGVADLPFMGSLAARLADADCLVSRCGYTGEDGFEISLPAAAAERAARLLLGHAAVQPIGLGARDSLRLEAGLCLYGHDIDETTTPIEANLAWSIGKRRRQEGGYSGAEIVADQLAHGVERKRVGLRPEGRAPAREGAEICDDAGNPVGTVTSGGFGPSVGGPVAMGYVRPDFSKVGTRVGLLVRGKTLPAQVAALPFVKPNYYRN